MIITMLLFVGGKAYSQEGETLRVVGDSLVGKTINGQAVRQVYGNVVMTQGSVRITCDEAVQFIANNNAELIGNVIATQDTLTIVTDRAFYYGGEHKAESKSGVKLDDKKVVLTADTGVYYFNEHKADFAHRVKLVDTSSTLLSDRLIYFKDEGKAIATGDVKITQNNNIIKADSLIHFRKTRVTYAYNNVSVSNPSNNAVIFGGNLEDFPETHYSIMTKNPLLIQIDTSFISRDSSEISETADTSAFRIDTLVIKSGLMQSYRDTINTFKAEDSVEIVQGDFASLNNYTIYYRNRDKILTYKRSAKEEQPVIWSGKSQLTGDSVVIALKENKIKTLHVMKDAFIMSQNSEYPARYDQMSGSDIKIHFDDGGIKQTDVGGGIHSIYYLYEDSTANGLTKSSAQDASILFNNKKVSTVKLFGSAASDYYPEKMVLGKERSFTLPGFNVIKNRPNKEEMLKNYSPEFERSIH